VAGQLLSRTAAATTRIGRRIGARLQPGDVLALEGELGSGKTTLVKGIAQARQVSEPFTSPTFTLISRYPCRLAGGTAELVHVDLYRIRHELELEELGLEEIMGGRDVTVIEWGEKARRLLPPETIRVRLELAPDGARRIRLEGLRL